MSTKTKQWGAIIVMIALFAMIAFVTNLCSPMAVIVKNQFGASNFLSQIGNYGNFIAYLVMGIPVDCPCCGYHRHSRAVGQR